MLAHVAVAVAVELHDATLASGRVGGQLLVVDRPGRGDEEGSPPGLLEALAEIGLVRVHEELRIEEPDLLGRAAADEHRARLGPAHRASGIAPALDGQDAMKEQGTGQSSTDARQTPGAGLWPALGVEQLRSGGAGFGACG